MISGYFWLTYSAWSCLLNRRIYLSAACFRQTMPSPSAVPRSQSRQTARSSGGVCTRERLLKIPKYIQTSSQTFPLARFVNFYGLNFLQYLIDCDHWVFHNFGPIDLFSLYLLFLDAGHLITGLRTIKNSFLQISSYSIRCICTQNL